jgi:hypothetical protein
MGGLSLSLERILAQRPDKDLVSPFFSRPGQRRLTISRFVEELGRGKPRSLQGGSNNV